MAHRLEARKAVVFNLANEEDKELFEFASKNNFSKLVRKYLRNEMKRTARVTSSSASAVVQIDTRP